MEARAKRLEAAADAHAELQARQEPLEQELRLWRSTLDGVAAGFGPGGPEAVLQLLDDLRSQLLALKEQCGGKEAEAHRLEGELIAHCPMTDDF